MDAYNEHSDEASPMSMSEPCKPRAKLKAPGRWIHAVMIKGSILRQMRL